MFVHTVIMVIEPHMKQGRQHKLISTIFLATSVTKKLDHNILWLLRYETEQPYARVMSQSSSLLETLANTATASPQGRSTGLNGIV